MFALRVTFLASAASAFAPAAVSNAGARRAAVELHAVDPIVAVGAVAAGGAAVAALSSDNRDIDDKKEVESYFNGEVGFGRWNKIYSVRAFVGAMMWTGADWNAACPRKRTT